MKKKRNAVVNAALEQLRERHEATRQRLVQGLPQVFGLPVDDVPEFDLDPSGTQSGILVSNDQEYRWELSQGTKKIVPLD